MTRILAGLWAIVAGAAAGSTMACSVPVFACQSDGQCEAGQCVSGNCAFEDADCPSMLRYGAHANAKLAGLCVEPAGDSDGTPPFTTTASDDGITQDSDSSSGTTTTPIGESSSESSTSDNASESSADSTSESSGDDGPSVDPDLIAWYPCDEGRAGVEFDASGNGNHGTCTDCPVVTEGLDGGACLFDNGQSIVVEHNVTFELQAFTLAAWAWPEPLAPDTLYTIVAKPAGTEQRNAYEIGFNSFNASDVALMCYGSGTESGCHSTPVVTGQWVHVAMTYDDGGARLYIDGELRAEDSPAIDGIGFDGAPLLIGIDYDDGLEAHPMLGLVDDVRLYGRALEQDEIAALAGL